MVAQRAVGDLLASRQASKSSSLAQRAVVAARLLLGSRQTNPNPVRLLAKDREGCTDANMSMSQIS